MSSRVYKVMESQVDVFSETVSSIICEIHDVNDCHLLKYDCRLIEITQQK